MKVEDTGEGVALPVPVGGSQNNGDRKFCVRCWRWSGVCVTYEAPRKATIVRSVTVSFCVVSLNPGVSIKTTRRPSSSKAPAICTVFVQESSPSLTPRLDPLTRLMNCADGGDIW